MFREQVGKLLNASFHENTMVHIRDAMKKKDTCVISLILVYYSKGENQKNI